MCVCSCAPALETIAELCFEKFRALPKTGKPTENEWTILAGIVEHDEAKNISRVVAIGCGTKCIGQRKLCANGLILNDSHAEVLARRAFLRYLQLELLKACDANVKSIFSWQETECNFRLKEQYKYHFLSTQTPCGDACIAVDTTSPKDFEQQQQNSGDSTPAKRARLQQVESDLLPIEASEYIFTGAKLIGSTDADAMQQSSGCVRTKPGRGDRTLSMSCSDKLSRWHILGVQGALLDMLLAEPIYFSTYNFCCADANEVALSRALYTRWHTVDSFTSRRYRVQVPLIRIAQQLNFEHAQQAQREPSPNGLVWSALTTRKNAYEISVNGKRQGVTKKKLDTAQAALAISKYYLLAQFISILRTKPALLAKFNLVEAQLEDMTYSEYKMLATEYQAAWLLLKRDYFGQWTQKPSHLLAFKVTLPIS